VWRVGLTGEIKLRFQVSKALCGSVQVDTEHAQVNVTTRSTLLLQLLAQCTHGGKVLTTQYFKVHLTPKYICSSNKCLCYVKKVGAIFFYFVRFLSFLCAVKVEKYLAQVRVYQGPGASKAVT